MGEIVELIEKVGFPIVFILVSVFLFKDFISNFFAGILQELREDKQALKEELTFNREVATKLLATNEILAKDVVSKMDSIQNNIVDLNKKIDDAIK